MPPCERISKVHSGGAVRCTPISGSLCSTPSTVTFAPRPVAQLTMLPPAAIQSRPAATTAPPPEAAAPRPGARPPCGHATDQSVRGALVAGDGDGEVSGHDDHAAGATQV